MSMVLTAEPLPLAADADGVVRVAKTRVTLDTVVAAFHDGSTAEEIAEQYPALRLGEVYAVIGYYLRHREEIESYLEQREQLAVAVRQRIDAKQRDLGDIRRRFLAARPA